MRGKIKIKFGTFWHDFDPKDNFFTKALAQNFEIEFSDDPDFYFFTHAYDGNKEYLKYKCHRVFLGWENERADWSMCDYVLDSDFYENNTRHKRFPIWAAWDMNRLVGKKDLDFFKTKTKFCCMVVSNPHAKERIDFYQKLSTYKKVDSGGRFLNNIGYNVENKLEFIKDYKFVISFENSSHPGYTTEKLIEPMLVNTIPLYWGNPDVHKDFNTQSFINVPDYATFDEAVDFIAYLDSNDEAYYAMASQPWFRADQYPMHMSEDSLCDFLKFVVDDSKDRKPVARQSYQQNLHILFLLMSKVKWKANSLFRKQRAFR